MIKASHLTKSYKNKLAVDNISFEVKDNKVTGFLGPNGAGKSTTMRLMLGLNYGKGSVTYDGKKLNEYKKPSQMVGILLEAKAFHPTRSAYNHLKILATAGEIPLKRVDEVLDIVGLKSEAKKQPGKFSLGMSQRLGVAAALLGSPKYLLLDEPANGLDPEGIVWLREFLKDYASEGRAVFISSHLLSEMSQLADNVIVIGKGKLLADTSISKLISDNVASSVFLRVSDPSKFESVLKDNKLAFVKEDNGLKITGTSTDSIGKMVRQTNLTVLELANHKASLEEAFLELTAGSEEFKAHARGDV